MINYIIGNIVAIADEYIVIENNGIGYKVFTSNKSIIDLEVGKKNQMIYTQVHPRDDALLLYGFSSQEEMDMFNMLLRVSKIGPKIGIGILSSLTSNQIKLAILGNDIKTLCQAPGVGKKTAERMILELRDRIDDSGLDLTGEEEILVQGGSNYREALEALVSLGYSSFEAEKALRSIDLESMTVEDIIREVLKKLARN